MDRLWKRPLRQDVLFRTPEALQEALCEYFQWADDNPIETEVLGWFQGVATRETVEHPRAYTIGGILAFLGINGRTWADWKDARPDLLPVIDWAYEVVREQKFTHAMVGVFNAGLTARDLGLSEKVDTTAKATVQVVMQGDDANL